MDPRGCRHEEPSHYGNPVELLAFIRSERNNLVLKPSDEYGGTGVTLGWETERIRLGRRDREACSLAARTACWIVQERIPIRREVFPYINRR